MCGLVTVLGLVLRYSKYGTAHERVNKGAESYIVSGINGKSDSVANTLEKKLRKASAFVASVLATSVKSSFTTIKSPILSLFFVLVLTRDVNFVFFQKSIIVLKKSIFFDYQI